MTKFVIESYYKNKHFNKYYKYVGQEKCSLIEGLKLIYQEDLNSPSSNNNDASSVKTVTASYAISLLIAKHSFIEGDFIKEYLIEAIKSFGISLTLAEIASILLTKKIVASRIHSIACLIKEKLKCLLASCCYFSLCLDESQ